MEPAGCACVTVVQKWVISMLSSCWPVSSGLCRYTHFCPHGPQAIVVGFHQSNQMMSKAEEDLAGVDKK